MTTPSSGRGAVPIGDDQDNGSTRPPWLIPLLAVLAVLLVGLLLWLLLRDGDDDDELETAATPSVSASPSGLPSDEPEASDITTTSPTAQASPTSAATTGAAASPSAPAGDEAVALTAGNEEVFPLQSADQDLSGFQGEVVGRSVPVESVPADEGFWLGTGPDQRIWVEIVAIEGETPFTVRPGEKVTFTGAEVVPHDASYAQRLNITADEGADQLTAQKAHVQVRAVDMRAN